jgi:hypothetical protein
LVGPLVSRALKVRMTNRTQIAPASDFVVALPEGANAVDIMNECRYTHSALEGNLKRERPERHFLEGNTWRVGRAVYGDSLENCRGGNSSGGSNPSPSAKFRTC